MKLIDSHCHLHYYKDYLDKIENAKNENVCKFLNIFEIGKENEIDILNKIIEIPNIYASAGVHPCDIHNISLEKAREKLININQKCVAFGETGIDLYQNQNSLENQIEYLKMHIELCEKYNKTLVIHSRNVDIDIILSLLNKNIKFIFHCFTYGKIEMEKIIKLGGFVSYSGIITFNKKVENITESLKHTPLNHLLLETDSPFLAPIPFRGKENESKYMKYIYQKTSEIMDISITNISENIYNNFLNII